jgi:hypothetical protein
MDIRLPLSLLRVRHDGGEMDVPIDRLTIGGDDGSINILLSSSGPHEIEPGTMIHLENVGDIPNLHRNITLFIQEEGRVATHRIHHMTHVEC